MNDFQLFHLEQLVCASGDMCSKTNQNQLQAFFIDPVTQSMCGRVERSDPQRTEKPKQIQISFGPFVSR